MSVGLRSRRIDTLRGIAILLVLLHHFSIAYPLPEFVRAVVRNGNFGVTIFFVVSGFLITSNAMQRWGSLDRLDPLAFYTLRIARIVPCLLLLIAIVGSLDLAGLTLFQSHVPGSKQAVSPMLVYGAALGFWMNALIGRLGWVNYPLGILWSLSVEEVFYLSFPVVCLALRRPRWIVAFWLVIVLIGPVYRAAHQGDEGGFLFAYFAAFDGIAIGCLTALLAARISAPTLVPGWLRGAAASSMIGIYLSAPIGITNVWGVSAMAAGSAILLIGADRQPADCRSMTVVGWFGRLSYELYLFHLIVLGLFRTVAPASIVTGPDRLLLLVAFLVLSSAIAFGISRLYAEPINRALRRRVQSASKLAAVQPGRLLG